MFSFGILFDVIVLTGYLSLVYESEALVLLVYLEVAFFVAGFFFLLYRRATVKGSISVPVGISEKEKENLVRITVSNKSFLRMNRVKARVIVEDTLRGCREKTWMRLAEVPRGESGFVRSVILSEAGNYEITLKKLRVYDITGLLYRDIPVRRSETVQILPELHSVPVRLTMAVSNFYGESDVYDEHSPGHDNSETFQVRDYQQGDRLQNVHWKMTAKQDELVVREHSRPKSCAVVLFLNFYPVRRFRRVQDVMPYVETAASLSFSMLDAGCPHYVAWYDSDEMDVRRLMVDDEESLFYLIGTLMRVKWRQPKEEPVLRYREKYRLEPYVWALSLDQELVLKMGGETLTRFSEKELEKSLSQVELIL